MNAKCYGHKFQLEGVRLYRCLYNGIIVKDSDEELCSNCKRHIVAEQLDSVEYDSITITIVHNGIQGTATIYAIRHDNLCSGQWVDLAYKAPWE